MQDESETTDSGISKLRYWLQFAGKTIPLGLGSFTLGRHAGCSLTFDDHLISRRHAQIEIDESGATLVDLESANGVYLNGERISAPARLSDGDRIVIGGQELVLVRMTQSWRPRSEVITRVDGKAAVLPPSPDARDDAEDEPASFSAGMLTARADALEVLGGVAQKMLAKGHVIEAERLLATHLSNAMTQARAGALANNPALVAKAAEHALRLAGVTKKSEWVNYVLLLYEAVERPIPPAATDELYALARAVPVDLALLRRYLDVLRTSTAELGPTDKFLLRRLEGLEQLVAAK